MSKTVELRQTVTRGINYTTWTVPRIRDGDCWRNIDNSHLVVNHFHKNGHDRYEDAIFKAKEIMEKKGWRTEITGTDEWCHEHLIYQHYRLKCWK